MVTKINNILPFQTNKDIIQMLINQARWKIASDVGRFEGEERNTDVNKMLDKNINNAGFSHVTFDRKFIGIIMTLLQKLLCIKMN